MAAQLEPPVRALFEKPNFVQVGTIRKDGTPHIVPTWVDVDGEDLVLNSDQRRAWPTNLRRDPRVTLSILNSENPYEFATVRGRMTGATRDGAGAHIDKLAQKYLGTETYPFHVPDEERVIIRIEPESVYYQAPR